MSALAARLLARLADGRLHSGEELAGELDVTRTTVWNLVGELREKGVDVESVDRRGYRLPAAVELLDAAAMRAAAAAGGWTLPAALVVAFEVDSTNTELFAPASSVPAEPRVLFAELQRAGRGRRGRSWHAPFGSGLTFSIGWPFVDTPPDFPALTLALGVAVARGLRAAGARGVGLKWPNDIVTADGKLGGLLTEARQESGASAYSVAGLGLNLSLPQGAARLVVESGGVMPADLQSCMDMLPSRNALAARLVHSLVDAFEQFGRSGFAAFIDDWRELDRLRGCQVRIEQARGVREGTVRGIDPDGALLLESATGAVERIVSGDVRVRISPERGA
jgi:BirA family biotin operon repressor/biotin-[acetyl-CoA-carboxylase] ligase